MAYKHRVATKGQAMTTSFYPAVMERAGDGFGVYFPDLPGCTSAGDTTGQAAHNAAEALSGHIAEMSAHGDPIPAPSDLAAIEHDPNVDEVARILVPAELPTAA